MELEQLRVTHRALAACDQWERLAAKLKARRKLLLSQGKGAKAAEVDAVLAMMRRLEKAEE